MKPILTRLRHRIAIPFALPSMPLSGVLHPRRAVALLAAAVAAVLIASIGHDLRREYFDAIETVSARTSNVARLLEEHARQSLRRVELSVSRAAVEASEAGDLAQADRGVLRRRLRDLLPADGLISLFLILDSSGVVVASTLTEELGGLPAVANREYFVAHRERAGLGMVIGAPARGRVTGRWMLPASLRLEAPGGAFRGVLVAFVDPARLQAFYDSIDTGSDGFVTLFHRDGGIVTRSPFDEKVLARNWSDSPMFREHLPAAATKTVRQVVLADSVERIYSYRALADYPVVVSLGLSLTDALAPWRAHVWRDGILLLMSLGALAGAAWGLTRQMRRREATETALREREALLQAVMQGTSDAVYVKDAQGRYLMLNRSGLQIVGKSPAEVLGNDDRTLFGPERGQYIRERDRQVMEADAVLTFEETVDVAGAERVFLSTTGPLRDAQGRPSGLYGITRDITERKRAEEALRESERRLAALIGNLPGVVYRCRYEPGYAMEFVSERMIAITGYPARDFMEGRRSIADFIHPEDVERVRAEMQGASEAGKPYEMTYRMVDAAGGEKWVWEKGAGVRGPDGEVAALEGFVIDVTERKRAEEALRASDERFRTAFDDAPVGVCLATRDGRFTQVNREFCRQLGYEERELLSRGIADITHPDDRPASVAAARALWTGETGPIEIEKSYLRKDGSVMRAITRIALLRGADGASRAGIAHIMDITERRRVERALRESEARYRELVENVSNLICIHDFAGTVLFANRASEERLGYTPEQLTGRNLREMVAPALRGEFDEYIARIRREGRASGLLRLRTASGESRILEFHNTLQQERDGEPTVLGVAHDVSERLRAEATLRELSTRLAKAHEDERRVVARALHDDVGQALTAVRLNLQAVRRARDATARAAALADGVGMVDEAIERVRSMSLDLRPQALDDLGLGPALDAYCARQSERARIPVALAAARVTRNLKGPAALACYRIAQEAITNALRHAKAKSIRVVLASPGGGLVLKVEDDGAGFNPDAARMKRALGLLGMRERAELAGGTLSIDSWPGRGTRVRAEFTGEVAQA